MQSLNTTLKFKNKHHRKFEPFVLTQGNSNYNYVTFSNNKSNQAEK